MSGAVAFLLPLAVVLLDTVYRPNTANGRLANTDLVTFVLACLSVPLLLGAWMGHEHGSASRSELVVKGSLMVVITGVVGVVEISFLILLAGENCTGAPPGEVPCVSNWWRPQAQDFLAGIAIGSPTGALVGLVQAAGMAGGVLAGEAFRQSAGPMSVADPGDRDSG